MTFLGCCIPGRVPTGTALGLGSFTQCLNLPGTVFVSAAVTCCSPKADRAQHMHMGRSHASRAACLITNFYEKLLLLSFSLVPMCTPRQDTASSQQPFVTQ